MRLAELAAQARAAGRLGIDTEFLPEGRYRPLLCLVQVCIDDQITLLDPLEGELDDPAPLASVMADPEVEIIVHSGRQDVAILRREWETEFSNVFDTQVAAGFAGYPAQASYTALLNDVLRVRPAKSASFTRWNARPLTREQLGYAREDVAHLGALADELQRRLTSSGRLQWAREECLAVATSSDIRNPDEAWRRLPRSSGMSGRDRARARALAAWRERTAAAEDKPVATILRDPTLVELVKRGATKKADLKQIRGVGSEVIKQRGEAIIAALREGEEAAPIPPDHGPQSVGESPQAGVVVLAEALVRARAQEAGLAYELIAARADLVPIVAAARAGLPEPDVRTLRGWRRGLVGAELLDLLAGRRKLSVGADGTVVVERI